MSSSESGEMVGGKAVSGEESRCPVTGLPLLTRPEWNDVELDDGYRASFFFLGDSILVGRPAGFGTMKGVKKLVKLTAEIQSEIFRPGLRYVRIIDCSDFNGMSPNSPMD